MERCQHLHFSLLTTIYGGKFAIYLIVLYTPNGRISLSFLKKYTFINSWYRFCTTGINGKSNIGFNAGYRKYIQTNTPKTVIDPSVPSRLGHNGQFYALFVLFAVTK